MNGLLPRARRRDPACGAAGRRLGDRGRDRVRVRPARHPRGQDLGRTRGGTCSPISRRARSARRRSRRSALPLRAPVRLVLADDRAAAGRDERTPIKADYSDGVLEVHGREARAAEAAPDPGRRPRRATMEGAKAYSEVSAARPVVERGGLRSAARSRLARRRASHGGGADQAVLAEHVLERRLADLLEAVGHAEAGSSNSIRRRRSIGVPIRTSSASSARSSRAARPSACGRSPSRGDACTCGYSRACPRSSRRHVAVDRRARRAVRFAASTAAPKAISPCVSVGPSSTARTRLPRICSASRRRRTARRRGRPSRSGRVLADRVEHGVDAPLRGAVDLVRHADVGHAQVRLARVVAKLVAPGRCGSRTTTWTSGPTNGVSLFPPSQRITSASCSA